MYSESGLQWFTWFTVVYMVYMVYICKPLSTGMITERFTRFRASQSAIVAMCKPSTSIL
jgi:hypothetical protein